MVDYYHSSIFNVILHIFFIKGLRTIVFIFIVISTTFWLICHPAFFRCLSNSGTFTELQATSFIESMGVVCSDSVRYNWVQELSFPVLLVTCSQDWTCNLQMIVSLEAWGTNAYNRYTMCPKTLNDKNRQASPQKFRLHIFYLFIILYLPTVVCYQVFLFKINNLYTITYSSNYFYLIIIICRQLYGSKYFYLTLIISL